MRSAWIGELLKIRTVRGQVVGVLLATVAIPLTSLLVVASDGLAANDSLTTGAATGSLVGLLAFGSWAAVVVAGEFSRQTLVVSLAVVPRRVVFYVAKLGAVAVSTVAGAIVSAVVSLAVVWAVTPRGVHPVGNPAQLLSVALVVLAVTAIGVAAGVLTRSPVASVAVVFAVVLLPRTAGGLLGGLQPWVVGASPATVVTQLVGNTQLTGAQTYPPGTAAAVSTLLAVAGVAAGWGAFALARRDG